MANLFKCAKGVRSVIFPQISFHGGDYKLIDENIGYETDNYYYEDYLYLPEGAKKIIIGQANCYSMYGYLRIVDSKGNDIHTFDPIGNSGGAFNDIEIDISDYNSIYLVIYNGPDVPAHKFDPDTSRPRWLLTNVELTF